MQKPTEPHGGMYHWVNRECTMSLCVRYLLLLLLLRLPSRLAIFQWILHEILSGNQLWLTFLWTTYHFKGVKVDFFHQNTKNGLKSIRFFG